MTKKEKQKYLVRDFECYNRKCFVPFSGNGIDICRLYEIGSYPEYIKNKDKTKLRETRYEKICKCV